MEHHFNHRAESFDSPKNQFLAELIRKNIEKQMHDLSSKSILDFGGGTGLISLPLAKKVNSVTLVDISDKMLSKLVSRLKTKNLKI